MKINNSKYIMAFLAMTLAFMSCKKVFEDIDIMYNTATNVVSFNLLSPINTTHHEGFFYVHPGLMLDMLIEKYQNVVLRHNYSPDVYTVLIYKF